MRVAAPRPAGEWEDREVIGLPSLVSTTAAYWTLATTEDYSALFGTTKDYFVLLRTIPGYLGLLGTH